MSRRTFIKRTGGATLAAIVAWNMTAQRARAEEQGSGSGSGSVLASYMCAIAPLKSENNIIGIFQFQGGGLLRLDYRDSECYQEANRNHHSKSIGQLAKVVAIGELPGHVGSWILKPYGAQLFEANTFSLKDNEISRQHRMSIGEMVYSRKIQSDPLFELKLEITQVLRGDNYVEISALAWFEGTHNGVTYGKDAATSGTGRSQVVKNPQDYHNHNDCMLSN